MNAIERLKHIEKLIQEELAPKEDVVLTREEWNFLSKALNIMREAAIYYAIDIQNEFLNPEEIVDEEFKRRMEE